MAKSIQILSTKVLSSIQKQELQKANIDLVEANFIETQNKPFKIQDINENLIFTSQNAVHSVLSDPKSEELKKKIKALEKAGQ